MSEAKYEAEPRYTRSMPDKWPKLLALTIAAQGQIQAGEDVHQEGDSLDALSKQIIGFDMLALDRCRYFAAGFMICELAKIIQQPEGYVAACEEGIASVVALSESYDRPHLTAKTPASKLLNCTVDLTPATAQNAHGNIDMAVSGLGEILFRTSRHRKQHRDGKGFNSLGLERALREVDTGNSVMLQTVQRAANVGSSQIVNEFCGRRVENRPIERQCLRAFKDDIMHDTSLLRAVRETARKNLIDFDDAGGAANFIAKTQGAYQFVKLEGIPRSASPKNANYGDYSRTTAIVCPAMNVIGMLSKKLCLDVDIAIAVSKYLEDAF